MGLALYRTYRSKNLAEVIGQGHITRTLDNALKSDKISHAYLFTGPRGVGKTSIARILAHEVNKLPYDDESQHLDIIEIDAASNRRIDEIRDLRDKVHIAPTSARYKVYIIDEVHMLTKEAFNALLKTLEEPPAHVIFILATTDLQKVPETIVSRTQRFAFKHISTSDISAHLKTIAIKEGIDITDDALELLADHAEGGFRDAINLLDQTRHQNTQIDINTVNDMLGILPHGALNSLWESLSKTDMSMPHKLLDDMLASGIQPVRVAKSLLELAIEKKDTHRARLFMKVLESKFPRVELTLALIEASDTVSPTFYEQTVPTVKVAPKKLEEVTKTSEKLPTPKPLNQSEPKVTTTEEPTSVEPTSPKKPDQVSSGIFDADQSEPPFWKDVLAKIESEGEAIYAPLRLAKAHLSDKTVVCELDFPFHIKRLSEAKNSQTVEATILSISGESYTVEFKKSSPKLTTEPSKPKTSTPPTADPQPDQSEISEIKKEANERLNNIQNIFGSAELL